MLLKTVEPATTTIDDDSISKSNAQIAIAGGDKSPGKKVPPYRLKLR